MYSVWSFSSWQLQNCSVRPNEMCTGTVKGLEKCDKSVGWYMAVQLSVHIYIDMMVLLCVSRRIYGDCLFDSTGISNTLYLAFL